LNPAVGIAADPVTLLAEFRRVRAATLALSAPLEIEDHVVQTMPDVSPPKWHLAHTTWFFDTFVLEEFEPEYQPVHPLYRTLFNSYYVTVGDRQPRPERGFLSRPTVAEIVDYRRRVDERIVSLLERRPDHAAMRARVVLGLHHEQQHQELLLADIKHILATNPLQPLYAPALPAPAAIAAPLRWREFAGGLHEFGHAGDGFAFDNESPRHPVYVAPFALGTRCVTNGEWREFIADGGYGRASLWLADGWAAATAQGWRAPLYWREIDDRWVEFTLGGVRPVRDEEPVVHISYFEADAFARWQEARLPTEFEWELVARTQPVQGNFADSGRFHPSPAAEGMSQMFGDVWELTRSDYAPYPGYRAPAGALGEYNGKFMCGQIVLRGGSCATPQRHMRLTYRNFFYPHQRWNFQGLRLARDA